MKKIVLRYLFNHKKAVFVIVIILFVILLSIHITSTRNRHVYEMFTVYEYDKKK